MLERKPEVETRPGTRPSVARGGCSQHLEVETFPLKVVPDWDEQVRRAGGVCRLIDRHLDGEARSRGLFLDEKGFRLRHLCPEQRVQMVTDLSAVTRDLV
jgi:hypothetical protein